MSDKSYVSPLDIHREQASLYKPKIPGANPTGQEIPCVVGGVDEEPIEVLYHAASRTAYPRRSQK